MNGENPRLKNPLLPRCVQSSLSSTNSTQHMRELLAGNRTSRNQVGAVDTHLLSNMLSDWLVSLMGLRGCLFSISSWGCDINHPLIPTCWIVFILRVWLSRDILAALFIVSCAKRFAIIFYSYSCIRSSCPIHFALHVPFSWLLFGCLLSIRLTSFGKSVVNVVLFIRCLMFLFISAKGSPRLCFIYSRCHFVFYVTAILSFFACKLRVSAMLHEKRFRWMSAVFNRRKPPNCEKCGSHISGTSSQDWTQVELSKGGVSWVRLIFLVRRARRMIVASS